MYHWSAAICQPSKTSSPPKTRARGAPPNQPRTKPSNKQSSPPILPTWWHQTRSSSALKCQKSPNKTRKAATTKTIFRQQTKQPTRRASRANKTLKARASHRNHRSHAALVRQNPRRLQMTKGLRVRRLCRRSTRFRSRISSRSLCPFR